jgi:hypothetical protein
LPKDVAVLGVEVPRAADGLLAVHQNAHTLAHLAVEKLQAQLLARGGVLAELVERDQEVAVGAHLQRHAEFACGLQQALLHAVLAWLDDDEFLGLVGADGASEFGRETAAVVGVVQRVVVYGVALLAQPVAEVAHRAQENRNPRLVAPHMGRLFGDFRHPDGVAGGVKPVQRGGTAV